MAQKLYVIGNGFDLYHGLDTKYESFGCFLQKHHNDIYELLVATCPLDSSLQWSDFESALGEFDDEEVWDRVSNYMNDDEPERSGEASCEAERIIDDLTSGLRKAFKDFILKVKYPESISDKKLNVDKNARYLSFNYTDTLERYYGVDRSHILYIHNKAEANSKYDLILGHDVSKDTQSPPSIQEPEGLTPEQHEIWMDEMSSQYSLSAELAGEEISRYYERSFKPVEQVIGKNKDFFAALANVNEILVMGHSLSEVDDAYFYEIIKNINSRNVRWKISYYEDIDDARNKFSTFKISPELVQFLEMKKFLEESYGHQHCF